MSFTYEYFIVTFGKQGKNQNNSHKQLRSKKMKKHHLNISYRTIIIIAFLAFTVAFFSLLPQSAEMKSDSEMGGQVISPLKTLAFRKVFISPPSSFDASLIFFNADGTGEQVIANFNPGDFSEPAWSPDGTKILFNVQGNIILRDGENSIPLANTAATEKNPSWSVTGKIVYERSNEIWIMNEDGTDQTLFSGITQSVPKAPKWSPDGSKLAFTSGGEVWVINSDGTNERRVTNNSTMDKEPDWSSDGTKLIYQKGSTGIAVINLDGTNETNLTDGVDDRTPAWSNDGVNIAFIRRGSQNNGLYVMDANGENQVRIAVEDYVRWSF